MGYFSTALSSEPLEILESVKRNLELFLDEHYDELEYRYLIETFAKGQLERAIEQIKKNPLKSIEGKSTILSSE